MRRLWSTRSTMVIRLLLLLYIIIIIIILFYILEMLNRIFNIIMINSIIFIKKIKNE